MGQAVLEELKRIIEDSEVSLCPQLQTLSGSSVCMAQRRPVRTSPQDAAATCWSGSLQLQYSWDLVATEASSDGLARPLRFKMKIHREHRCPRRRRS